MMNLKYIVLLLTIFSLNIQAQEKSNPQKNTSQGNSQEETCMCYCSDLCGPRLPNHPGDAPFYDEEYGICFCQERDKVNYVPHGCNTKPVPNFNSCCEATNQ
jgi:hypothetical protein